jgi:HTH-type transcriptional regulator / antitoxin HigA
MNEYEPDYAVPPSETLAEVMAVKELSRDEIASLTNLSEIVVGDILNGQFPITEGIATALAMAFDIPASFWLNLQRQYDEIVARLENEGGEREQQS